jgi:peptide/nickel transport system substrate-binding protein
MNIAIDRNALVKTFYRGEASPSPTFWSLPGWEKLEPIPYNPGRAKQLLTEAGYPNGFGFKFYTHSKRAEMGNIGEAVAGYWEAIGVKPEIVRGDYATWRSINKTGKTAGFVWTHVNGNQPDWSESLSEYELPNAATPIWQSEETKTAITKVLQELDPQKREANFKQLAQLYRSTYSHVPIVYSPKVSAASKTVGEWNPCQLYAPKNIIFARHPVPLNTFRLFTP